MEISCISKAETGLPMTLGVQKHQFSYYNIMFHMFGTHWFTYMIDYDNILGDVDKVSKEDIECIREWVKDNRYALSKLVREYITINQFRSVMFKSGQKGSTDVQRNLVDIMMSMNNVEKIC